MRMLYGCMTVRRCFFVSDVLYIEYDDTSSRATVGRYMHLCYGHVREFYTVLVLAVP